MASPLAAIWQDTFTRESVVWGKQVVLRALHNYEVEEIASLVAERPLEHQLQAQAILTVAASLQSVDGLGFTDADTGRALTLLEKANEIRQWDDALTAALHRRYTQLAIAQAEQIEGLADPNSSTRHEDSTAPS